MKLFIMYDGLDIDVLLNVAIRKISNVSSFDSCSFIGFRHTADLSSRKELMLIFLWLQFVSCFNKLMMMMMMNSRPT